MEQIKRFFNDEDGTQVTETALVLGLISVAAIATLLLIGPKINDVYVAVNNALTPAAEQPAVPAP